MCDLQQKILEDYDIIVRSYKDAVIDDIPSFLKHVNSITDENEDSIIQLLDSDYICGESHLNQAIAHAIKSFQRNENFANDKGLEICVRLSAQKQINVALDKLGIKNNGNITVVYINTSNNQIEKLEEILPERCDSIIEDYDRDRIIESYELDTDIDIVDSINEKIALLSIKT